MKSDKYFPEPQAAAATASRTDAFLHWLHIALSALVVAMMLPMLNSCKHTELWDDVPGPIAEFINQYFPFSELNSVTHSASAYHIRIDDGPGLTFGSDYAWEVIDGYGMPLPQVLLFDQLPPKMYQYLQETEQLNEVFSMSRDDASYTASLLNTTLTYKIADESLTTYQPTP